MYDTPIEDFVQRHQLSRRQRLPSERAPRRRRSETGEHDIGRIANAAAVLIERILSLYRLHASHELAERIREQHAVMLDRRESVGPIRSLSHANIEERTSAVFGVDPDETDQTLMNRYETAFQRWFDQSFASGHGGYSDQYAMVLEERNTSEMSYILERLTTERVLLRNLTAFCQTQLVDRDRIVSASEAFLQLAELYTEIGADEIESLSMNFDDYQTLHNQAERVGYTLRHYVRLLDEMIDRFNEAAAVNRQRYEEMSEAILGAYDSVGGYEPE
jgi:hypothetical protein